MTSLEIYTKYNENQLRRFYEPKPGIFICENERNIRRAVDAGYEIISMLIEEGKEEIAREIIEVSRGDFADILIYVKKHDELKNLTGYNLTGGMLCAMRRKALPEVSNIISRARRIAILDDIENPTNIGAIFRCAAGIGMDAILLTRGCSDPLYRRAARVSMGSVFAIPWACCEVDITPLLKSHGFASVAMALSDNSINIDDPSLKSCEKLAVILGNEDKGITPPLLESCDYVAKIPMQNNVDSLNVGSAAAIAFWELR